MSYFDYDDAPPGPPPPVYLYSCCLLSKHGFQDGDELRDFICDYLGEEGNKLNDGFHPAHHVLLIALVREKLLPLIQQKVEVEEIGTIHNPIRATTVGGVSVNDIENIYDHLKPDGVDIPGEEVLAIARRIIAEKGK